MRLALKLKDGKRYFYSEEQSKIIARSINYVKLAQFLIGNNPPKKGKVKILNQVVEVENIKSIEFFM